MSIDSKKVIVELYHKSHSLVRHHLDSFNHFIETDLKKIVKAQGKINLPDQNWFMEFINVDVKKPTVWDHLGTKVDISPQQCRLRSITYAGNIVVDVRYSSQDRSKIIVKQNQVIGRMPIMVRSNKCTLSCTSDDDRVRAGECSYDVGGYFITKGTERVFLLQEQMAKNRMIIERAHVAKRGGKKMQHALKVGNSDIVCHVVSSTVENKSKTTVFKNNGHWYVENTMFTESVPLFILFAALAMPAHYDIFHCIAVETDLHNDLVASALEQNGQGVFSQQQGLRWLASRIKMSANRLSTTFHTPQTTEEAQTNFLAIKDHLLRRVLNHVPASTADLTPRARYLGLMVRRVQLAEHNHVLIDDRDFYGTKRIDLVGYYLSLAFDDKFQSFVEVLKKEIEKTLKAKNTIPFEPCNLMKSGIITDGMFSHIFTGNWSLRRFGMDRSKVTEVLNRLSYIATLGNLCKITSNFEKVRKMSGARSIHLSQYGLVCTADTPEGDQCGLIKNLAFMAEITVELSEGPLAMLIRSCDHFEQDLTKFQHCSVMHLVMLNGVAIGWSMEPWTLGGQLRQLRRRGLLHHHVSIYYQEDDHTLHISSDSGKLVRPYIVVEDGHSLLTEEVLQGVVDRRYDWQYLVSNGIIEYLDAREGYAECLLASCEADLGLVHTDVGTVNCTRSAVRRHIDIDPVLGSMYTHVDIDPATAMGPVASLIPFPHHNQSPRNTYQCAMGKQALGVVATNQGIRFDGTQHLLINPQKPLTLSNVSKLVRYDDIPAGQNAIVAITCFGGHDIEDALIINKASVERGFLRSLTVKSKSDILKENDALGMSTNTFRNQKEIQSDGTPAIGAFVSSGDVLISKFTMPERSTLVNMGVKDESGSKAAPTMFHDMDKAQVNRVLLSVEEHGYLIVKVSTCQMRTPEVGDKLSSRHGQKGVIGRVVPMEEMPYTEDGIVPDIIMNPHGFPSRMTVGKLIELLANKAAVMDGQVRNCSAFTEAGHQTIKEDYSAVLTRNGYAFAGKDVLMNGDNGALMECDIFMGPIFYQRLRHMVQDKVHARSTGKNTPMTRQPTTGRSNEGGLRVGEMERDCLIAYGATQILKERMMLSSDPFRTWVCERCGTLATIRNWCHLCRSSQCVSSVIMPYASKLLIQELGAMHIKVKFTLTRNDSVV